MGQLYSWLSGRVIESYQTRFRSVVLCDQVALTVRSNKKQHLNEISKQLTVLVGEMAFIALSFVHRLSSFVTTLRRSRVYLGFNNRPTNRVV